MHATGLQTLTKLIEKDINNVPGGFRMVVKQFLPLNARVELRPDLRSVYCKADAALCFSVGCRLPSSDFYYRAKLRLIAWQFGLLFTTNSTLD